MTAHRTCLREVDTPQAQAVNSPLIATLIGTAMRDSFAPNRAPDVVGSSRSAARSRLRAMERPCPTLLREKWQSRLVALHDEHRSEVRGRPEGWWPEL